MRAYALLPESQIMLKKLANFRNDFSETALDITPKLSACQIADDQSEKVLLW